MGKPSDCNRTAGNNFNKGDLIRMAIEKVKEYFKSHGMEGRIQEFNVSSATVELAAAALHCEPQRIAKTLSFMADGQDRKSVV